MSDIAKVHDIEWYSEVPRSIRKQLIFGMILLCVTFGGFGVWAFTAPLAAAVIAQGSFVATGRNKVVQHYEGGIIKELLVNEGDEVVEGQPLIKLDETAALAKERELFLRRIRLEASVARLTSQFENDEQMEVSDLLDKYRSDSEVWSIVVNQQLNFKAQRMKQSNELSLLRQNIKALEFRSIGYTKQRNAITEQLSLLREEHQNKKKLVNMGLLRLTEMKAIERAMADAQGQIGRLEAEVAETQAQIVKGQQEISRAEVTYREDALDKLQAIQGELDTVREQARQAENILRRVTIIAPVTGTVIRTFYHTPGGVIESGKGILEILPKGVPLIIEAQIPRNSIDSVAVGQTATVRLVALNQRTTPVLHGELFYISADALEDSKPGMPAHDVYLARIDIPASELAKVKGFHPTPGMPAEVMIQTAQRTFFSYLVKPITDSMSRAFTER
ncbi:HlyD family type I secretion periplasmic adaptor subunit [Rhizobium sp. ARZ01]|uniref:HlyD family type I secretion periplasmic adaptor subunit n=1 Tax=Rhizobium sp. ARZ01 TaxID=2769313 RepID=UPI0017850831|nr:HlyD family type I secretion periplasmic adaptor subunit [Rhizobium sp. ARZ01]MBD9375282.1 HlyD family type I secretion periplasmic adaptor subunit [Rhizobium sp. ARZ01]